MRNPVRIAAAENLAYLPHYIGIARGFFAEAGVEVSVQPQAPGHGSITDAVLRGTTDLVLGSVVFADRLNRAEPSVVVAVSNTQTRHFLFQRAQDPRPVSGEVFDWNRLRGSVLVVAPTYVPTSWVAFLEILHRQGIPLGEIKVLVGYQPEAVIDEFVDGPGDFLLAGGHEAQDSRLRETVPLADGLGPVPWSVYCATRGWAEGHTEEAEAFRAGLGQAQAWLAAHSPERIAQEVREHFPSLDVPHLEDTIAQFQRIGFWASSPGAVPGQFEAWRDALVRSGLLAADTGLLSMIGQAPHESTQKEAAS